MVAAPETQSTTRERVGKADATPENPPMPLDELFITARRAGIPVDFVAIKTVSDFYRVRPETVIKLKREAKEMVLPPPEKDDEMFSDREMLENITLILARIEETLAGGAGPPARQAAPRAPHAAPTIVQVRTGRKWRSGLAFLLAGIILMLLGPLTLGVWGTYSQLAGFALIIAGIAQAARKNKIPTVAAMAEEPEEPLRG